MANSTKYPNYRSLEFKYCQRQIIENETSNPEKAEYFKRKLDALTAEYVVFGGMAAKDAISGKTADTVVTDEIWWEEANKMKKRTQQRFGHKQEYNQKSTKRVKLPGETMAANFLPFIVEKSTPIHVYQTILSRSKGVPFNLIASVLNAVIVKSIKTVRKLIETSDEMPVNALYQHIANNYSDLSLSSEDISDFTCISYYITEDDKTFWPSELSELSTKEALVFLRAMKHLGKLEDYTKVNYSALINEQSEVLVNVQKYVTFSNKAPVKTFISNTDLLSFILYSAFVSQEPIPSIKARIVSKTGGEDDVPF